MSERFFSEGAPDQRFEQDREALIQELARQGISNRRVLSAMRAVPRQTFVSPGQEAQAYCNHALGIESGQTISQPYIVARMSEALEPDPQKTVLEIGTGSGYQTAILCELFKYVYSVERDETLSRQADQRLKGLGYTNYALRLGDGTLGWPEHAPYSAIIVTAMAPEIPSPLLSQLSNDHGHLVMPVGQGSWQELTCLTSYPEGLRREFLERVAFVPLIGEFGWPEPGPARPPENKHPPGRTGRVL